MSNMEPTASPAMTDDSEEERWTGYLLTLKDPDKQKRKKMKKTETPVKEGNEVEPTEKKENDSTPEDNEKTPKKTKSTTKTPKQPSQKDTNGQPLVKKTKSESASLKDRDKPEATKTTSTENPTKKANKKDVDKPAVKKKSLAVFADNTDKQDAKKTPSTERSPKKPSQREPVDKSGSKKKKSSMISPEDSDKSDKTTESTVKALKRKLSKVDSGEPLAKKKKSSPLEESKGQLLQDGHMPYDIIFTTKPNIVGVYKIAYDKKTIYVGNSSGNVIKQLRKQFTKHGNQEMYDFINSLSESEKKLLTVFWLDESVHGNKSGESYLKCIERIQGAKPRFNMRKPSDNTKPSIESQSSESPLTQDTVILSQNEEEQETTANEEVEMEVDPSEESDSQTALDLEKMTIDASESFDQLPILPSAETVLFPEESDSKISKEPETSFEEPEPVFQCPKSSETSPECSTGRIASVSDPELQKNVSVQKRQTTQQQCSLVTLQRRPLKRGSPSLELGRTSTTVQSSTSRSGITIASYKQGNRAGTKRKRNKQTQSVLTPWGFWSMLKRTVYSVWTGIFGK